MGFFFFLLYTFWQFLSKFISHFNVNSFFFVLLIFWKRKSRSMFLVHRDSRVIFITKYNKIKHFAMRCPTTIFIYWNSILFFFLFFCFRLSFIFLSFCQIIWFFGLFLLFFCSYISSINKFMPEHQVRTKERQKKCISSLHHLMMIGYRFVFFCC
jgi:hypothetical protein